MSRLTTRDFGSCRCETDKWLTFVQLHRSQDVATSTSGKCLSWSYMKVRSVAVSNFRNAKHFFLVGKNKISDHHRLLVGPGNLVGAATRYRLDGSGFEPRWEWALPRTSRPVLGPIQPLYSGRPVSCPGVKRPRRGVHNSPSSSAKVKERVKLYLYSPSLPSWHVTGWTSPFNLFTVGK